MKKFLIGPLILVLILSACAQTSGVVEPPGKEGIVYGSLMAAKREGFYIRGENNNTYLFELAQGLDLSDFDIGDKLYVEYRAQSGPPAGVCVLKVHMKYGTLSSVQSDSFTIYLTHGTTMTFGYAEAINMDGLEIDDCLYVEYVNKLYLDDDGEHVRECPEATVVLKVGD